LPNLNFDWYYTSLSKDILHIKLKECLFKYPSSAVSDYVAGIDFGNKLPNEM
jgi:hypothetical protein